MRRIYFWFGLEFLMSRYIHVWHEFDYVGYFQTDFVSCILYYSSLPNETAFLEGGGVENRRRNFVLVQF